VLAAFGFDSPDATVEVEVAAGAAVEPFDEGAAAADPGAAESVAAGVGSGFLSPAGTLVSVVLRLSFL
jgi:hypothetical protein